MSSQQEESRNAYRTRGKGLSAAAADDFCDCPARDYLGTGWVEETESGGRKDRSSLLMEIAVKISRINLLLKAS